MLMLTKLNTVNLGEFSPKVICRFNTILIKKFTVFCIKIFMYILYMMLLLSHFSRVRLCATP